MRSQCFPLYSADKALVTGAMVEKSKDLRREAKGILGDVHQHATNTVGNVLEFAGSTVGGGYTHLRGHAVDAVDFTNTVLGYEHSL